MLLWGLCGVWREGWIDRLMLYKRGMQRSGPPFPSPINRSYIRTITQVLERGVTGCVGRLEHPQELLVPCLNRVHLASQLPVGIVCMAGQNIQSQKGKTSNVHTHHLYAPPSFLKRVSAPQGAKAAAARPSHPLPQPYNSRSTSGCH